MVLIEYLVGLAVYTSSTLPESADCRCGGIAPIWAW